MRKKILLMAMLAAFVTGGLGLGGCNTVEGAGRDIENAGDSIQDAAD